MGLAQWYDRTIVPRLIRCGCGTAKVMELRENVVPLANGDVFELGCGGGHNQKLYDPAKVTHLCGVDPSPRLLDYAREEGGRHVLPVDIRQGVGEALPYDAASFDTVVTTFTLCSVDDHGQVLSELRRVLRPGGQLLFLEHGHAPDPGVARWQARIEPLWTKLMGNCHLTRPVTSAIEQAGFAVQTGGKRYMPGAPRFAGWMEWGRAVKG